MSLGGRGEATPQYTTASSHTHSRCSPEKDHPTPHPLAGKSVERPELSEEALERNTRGIERTLRTLLTPPPGSGLAEPLVLNNLDWFGSMGLLAFLKDVGE